jgi:hypothetical protein
LLSGWRQRGSDTTAVVRILDAAYKLISFETIYELSNIGADAAISFGKLTQRERGAGRGQISEDTDFR